MFAQGRTSPLITKGYGLLAWQPTGKRCDSLLLTGRAHSYLINKSRLFESKSNSHHGRQHPSLILCACFVSVAWGQQPASTCSNKWTEFHRPNMRRSNPCEKVLNVHNVGSLGLKWSYATRDFNSSCSPAVANGVVYVGSWDGKVYAFGLQ